MKNVSNKSCRENKNTHFMFHDFSRKSCRSRENVGRFGGAKEAADDNVAHAPCVLDK
jgi:hypothetical protein